MFTTNLEKHLTIIINRSMEALAEHSVRIFLKKGKRERQKQKKAKERTKQKKYCASE